MVQQKLISVEEAKLKYHNENVRFVFSDMRNPVNAENEPKTKEIIKGSVTFDLDGLGSDHNGQFPHTLLSEKDFSLYASQLNLCSSDSLVIYDSIGQFSAPRVWWMFNSYGHKNVYLLDGGLPVWRDSGLPLEQLDSQKTKSIHSQVASYQLNQFDDSILFCDQMLACVKSDDYQILDARSEARFNGLAPEPRPGLRKGHMPGAISTPFSDFLINGKFHSVGRMQTYFANKGVDLTKPIVTSCGSGVTACIVAFAAKLCGAKDVAIYDGSWSEWGALESLPIEL